MDIKSIALEEFEEYVYKAFFNDEEIIEYYDRSAKVKTTQEAIDNVCEKIKMGYPDAQIVGVEIKGCKEGYFVYKDNLLISFGMSLQYRNKETLFEFWEAIKRRLGNNFHSMLYSHNIRAINWLQKSGMKIEFDHITILSYN
jgi:hypothetical protein